MNKSFHISRRSFLRRTTLAAAATGLPLWFVERQLAAAEVAIGLAIIVLMYRHFSSIQADELRTMKW